MKKPKQRTKAQIAGAKKAAATRHQRAEIRHLLRRAAPGYLTPKQKKTLPPPKAGFPSRLHGTYFQNLGKKPVSKKTKRAAVMPEDMRMPGWSWVLGCNDRYPTCAAAAVANHLYAFTGIRMAEHEVLGLHKLAGGDEEDGAKIEDVLEYLYGCGGFSAGGKMFKLARFTETDSSVILTGLIVGLDFPHGSHSVLSHPDGMVSWGRVMPWRGEAEEAWAAEWMWLSSAGRHWLARVGWLQ